MSSATPDEYRFEVALSFAGDNKRALIRAVAERLRDELGDGKVFFDEWFEAEIAGPDAHIVLQNIYRRSTRLVVTCVCHRYDEKPWTQEEWRAIQALERTLRDAGGANQKRLRFLPLRFGDGEVDGIFETTIVPDVRSRPPAEIARLILDRLRLAKSASRKDGAEPAPTGVPGQVVELASAPEPPLVHQPQSASLRGSPPGAGTRNRRVFISYSHDSEAHRERVLALAARLRADGLDAWLDRYEDAPVEGWPRWMRAQIEKADFVLVICTETYRRRYEGAENAGQGRGVTWEGLVVGNLLYAAGGRSRRWVPVLFDDPESSVPIELQAFTRFRLGKQYDELYRLLMGQPEVVPPVIGKPVVQQSKQRKIDTASRNDAASAGTAGARANTPPPPVQSEGLPDPRVDCPFLAGPPVGSSGPCVHWPSCRRAAWNLPRVWRAGVHRVSSRSRFYPTSWKRGPRCAPSRRLAPISTAPSSA